MLLRTSFYISYIVPIIPKYLNADAFLNADVVWQ
jgi:hypothetical protein